MAGRLLPHCGGLRLRCRRLRRCRIAERRRQQVMEAAPADRFYRDPSKPIFGGVFPGVVCAEGGEHDHLCRLQDGICLDTSAERFSVLLRHAHIEKGHLIGIAGIRGGPELLHRIAGIRRLFGETPP